MLQVNGAMPEEDAVVVVRDILTVLAECNRQKVPHYPCPRRKPRVAPGTSLAFIADMTLWPVVRQILQRCTGFASDVA